MELRNIVASSTLRWRIRGAAERRRCVTRVQIGRCRARLRMCTGVQSASRRGIFLPRDDGSRMSAERMIAAIDLGSNSFHMVIARQQDGQLQVVDRLKEMVRLAAGLREDKTLS